MLDVNQIKPQDLQGLDAEAATKIVALMLQHFGTIKRQALPEQLPRIEHRHEPEDTSCPMHGCGRPMTRVGEDVSEELDIIPAQFFVHRHIYGKWACRCCQILEQEPAAPRIIDGGIPAAGLVAHTLEKNSHSLSPCTRAASACVMPPRTASTTCLRK